MTTYKVCDIIRLKAASDNIFKNWHNKFVISLQHINYILFCINSYSLLCAV